LGIKQNSSCHFKTLLLAPRCPRAYDDWRYLI